MVLAVPANFVSPSSPKCPPFISPPPHGKSHETSGNLGPALLHGLSQDTFTLIASFISRHCDGFEAAAVTSSPSPFASNSQRQQLCCSACNCCRRICRWRCLAELITNCWLIRRPLSGICCSGSRDRRFFVYSEKREWPFLPKSVPATVFDLRTFGLSDRRLSPSATDQLQA
ncbi:hypothetical protein LSTR_LSTR010860 [Laodelphax striatellus]|uniref:Uncharacterized protein n=1 Tax=Laodelphax striatellus TaxID=195883 RepID=A0A482WP43_LAOST|nr:hypothetical protein LSTR_LSTR010860 [Laodelphax striatellus]